MLVAIGLVCLFAIGYMLLGWADWHDKAKKSKDTYSYKIHKKK